MMVFASGELRVSCFGSDSHTLGPFYLGIKNRRAAGSADVDVPESVWVDAVDASAVSLARSSTTERARS
jgi:hypothetical protein